jgi:hypothetical protein
MILSSPQIMSLGEPGPMVVPTDNASMDRTARRESGRRRCYRETRLLERAELFGKFDPWFLCHPDI